jgi:hypothetical protein
MARCQANGSCAPWATETGLGATNCSCSGVTFRRSTARRLSGVTGRSATTASRVTVGSVSIGWSDIMAPCVTVRHHSSFVRRHSSGVMLDVCVGEDCVAGRISCNTVATAGSGSCHSLTDSVRIVPCNGATGNHCGVIRHSSGVTIHTSHFRPRTSDFRLQTSDFRLRTSDLGLRTSDFRLRTSDFRLQTSDFRLQTSDFRLLPLSRRFCGSFQPEYTALTLTYLPIERIALPLSSVRRRIA